MCGIYGMVSLSDRPLRHPALLRRMGQLLKHRGPDDSGTVACDGYALGAERLSIVDRSDQANQPFANASQSSWLVCNGEVYNAAALRSRFARYPYRSRCDVESLVPLLTDVGESGLDAVEGMFALAWWEPRERVLLLARDRAGEKPLYYTECRGELWFASEIQALLVHPDIARELDHLALSEYLTLGYVREPRSMFRHIRKVPAGVSLTFRPERTTSARTITLPPVSIPDTRHGAQQVLRGLLEKSVAQQMTADVPIGVLASGGMDSTLITALAMRTLGPGLRTFTASFEESSYDEGGPARRVARELGTTHVEVKVGEPQLADALHTLVGRMADPIADPALLPTFLVSREAKQHVGVVLTGEGADELFGGYPTYLGHAAAPFFARLPRWCRPATTGVISRLAATHRPNALSHLFQRFAANADAEWRERHLAWVGTGLMQWLDSARADDVTRALPDIAVGDPVAAAMEFDYVTYLRDGLLVKLDRAAMLVSLETRTPFLDPHLRSFAAALPRHLRVSGWRTKRLLKAVASDMVPRWVLRRRKRGLSVPIASWINGGLRGEVDRLLSPAALSRQGVLPALPINELLEQHRRGKANHARCIWPLVMLQYWLEQWVPE